MVYALGGTVRSRKACVWHEHEHVRDVALMIGLGPFSVADWQRRLYFKCSLFLEIKFNKLLSDWGSFCRHQSRSESDADDEQSRLDYLALSLLCMLCPCSAVQSTLLMAARHCSSVNHYIADSALARVVLPHLEITTFNYSK